jgi:hypothetical protein
MATLADPLGDRSRTGDGVLADRDSGVPRRALIDQPLHQSPGALLKPCMTRTHHRRACSTSSRISTRRSRQALNSSRAYGVSRHARSRSSGRSRSTRKKVTTSPSRSLITSNRDGAWPGAPSSAHEGLDVALVRRASARRSRARAGSSRRSTAPAASAGRPPRRSRRRVHVPMVAGSSACSSPPRRSPERERRITYVIRHGGQAYPGQVQARDGTGQRGHVAPKHVWVDGDGMSAARAPGILLDWRVVDGGRWEAHVVWANGGGNVKARSVLEWLPAERVTPRE